MKKLLLNINNAGYLNLMEILKFTNENFSVARNNNEYHEGRGSKTIKNMFFDKESMVTISKKDLDTLGVNEMDVDIVVAEESTIYGIPFDYTSPTAVNDVALYLEHLRALRKVYDTVMFSELSIMQLIEHMSKLSQSKKSDYSVILNSLEIFERTSKELPSGKVNRHNLLDVLKEWFIPSKIYKGNVSYLSEVQMGAVLTHNLEVLKGADDTIDREKWGKLIKTQFGRDVLGENWVTYGMKSDHKFSKDSKKRYTKYKDGFKELSSKIIKLRELRDSVEEINIITSIDGEIAGIQRDIRKYVLANKPKKYNTKASGYTRVVGVGVKTNSRLGGYVAISPNVQTRNNFSFSTHATLMTGKYGSGVNYIIPTIAPYDIEDITEKFNKVLDRCLNISEFYEEDLTLTELFNKIAVSREFTTEQVVSEYQEFMNVVDYKNKHYKYNGELVEYQDGKYEDMSDTPDQYLAVPKTHLLSDEAKKMISVTLMSI